MSAIIKIALLAALLLSMAIACYHFIGMKAPETVAPVEQPVSIDFAAPAEDVIERYSDVWVSDEGIVNIWYDEDGFQCAVMIQGDGNESVTVEYGTCTYDEATDQLLCTDGVRYSEYVDESTQEVSIVAVADDLTAAVRLEGNLLYWDDAEGLGENIAFQPLSAMAAEVAAVEPLPADEEIEAEDPVVVETPAEEEIEVEEPVVIEVAAEEETDELPVEEIPGAFNTPDADALRDRYLLVIADLPAETAGASLSAAAAAQEVLRFAADHWLWDPDIDTLRANLMDAWNGLTAEQQQAFDERFMEIVALLDACQQDWAAQRPLFEDAGVAEQMDAILSDPLSFQAWQNLRDHTLTLGNGES